MTRASVVFAASGAAILSCAALILIAVVELVWPGKLPKTIVDKLSSALNVYLEWRSPIYHRGNHKPIPTCPYQWPNGQGDVAKFLEGIANSAAWEKQYGGVYRIWSGMKSEVVLTQPHQIQTVFKDSNRHNKAEANNSGCLMDQLLGKCVGLISGSEWQSVRSVVDPPFGHHAVVAKVADIELQVTEHFKALQDRGNLEQDLLHPAEDLKMLPFWVVCEVFYGRLPTHLTHQLSQLVGLREQVFRYVIQGGLPRFCWSRYLPTAANADFQRFQRAWKAFNDGAYDYAIKHNPSAPIVAMRGAVQAGKLTEEQLLQTLDESLYANLDVTTGGLSWNVVFLAAHPEMQSRLRTELVKARAGAGERAYVVDSSTLLAACVLESARLKPLAAFSVPQAAPTAREVDGYIVPPGISFVVDAYALNVRNDAWAPDNEAYRPDRFVGARLADRRYLFWRFGFGPRQCMGKHVADLVIRQTLVHLVCNYELSLENAVEWTRNRHSWITHPDFRIGCVKRA